MQPFSLQAWFSSVPGNEFHSGCDVLRGLKDYVSGWDLSVAADVAALAIAGVAAEESDPVAPPVAPPGQPGLVHHLVVASTVDAANL